MAFQFKRKIFQTLKELLIANPKDLTGEAYGNETPEELKKDAKVCASLLKHQDKNNL